MTLTRLESRFLPNDSTRVTISDSRLESESFLQNLETFEQQTELVCTQWNEIFCLSDACFNTGAKFQL